MKFAPMTRVHSEPQRERAFEAAVAYHRSGMAYGPEEYRERAAECAGWPIGCWDDRDRGTR